MHIYVREFSAMNASIRLIHRENVLTIQSDPSFLLPSDHGSKRLKKKVLNSRNN